MRKWLMILVFLSGAGQSEQVLLKNIKWYSHDATALQQGDRLLFDTDSGRLLSSEGVDLSQVKTIDGQGRVVLPGLHDAHGHVLNYGMGQLLVDVRGLANEALTSQKVRDFAQANQEMPWVVGRGWNHVLWPTKSFPNKATLDVLVNDRPVFLSRVDGHAAWVNSRALSIAGITRETAKGNDLIIKDAEGFPTGVLIDNAMGLVRKHIPDAPPEAIDKALQLAFKDLLAVGLTTVHEAGISHDLAAKYQLLVQSNQMPMRIYGMLYHSDPQLKSLLEAGHVNVKDRFVMRSVKLMIDGALGSYGAILHEPYSDQPERKGAYVQTPDQVKRVLDQVVKAGFQANVHAIGDRGNTEVIDLLARPKMNSQSLRHRVEHAQILRLDDIPKFKNNHIIASVQPTHATSDMNMAEDRVGPDRIKGGYAWQSLWRSGAVVASGSDFPVELINPFYGLHAAVTRQDRRDQPEGGWYQNEALNLTQAFQSFTINAAFAAHAEKQTGSLDAGKYADFIVIDQDIFQIDAKEIWKTQVLETWVAGQRVYQK